MGLSSGAPVAAVVFCHLSRGEAEGDGLGEEEGEESLKSAMWKRGSGGVRPEREREPERGWLGVSLLPCASRGVEGGDGLEWRRRASGV